MKILFQSKLIRFIVLFCFIHLTLNETSRAAEQLPAIQNVHHVQTNTKFVVTYDLAGAVEKSYNVELVMLRKGDASFQYVPKHVSGDIGESIQPGMHHSLEWESKNEFPNGVTYDDVYFSLKATEDTSSSISPWIWIGGAVVVGVVIYLIAKKPKTTTPGEFPAPPGRP